MRKRRLYNTLLTLLALASLSACFQPIDLTPAEDPDIPWVYCILTTDSTQFVDLLYIDASGSGRYQPVEDAEATLEIWRQTQDGGEFYKSGTFPFDPVGNGRWQVIIPSLSGDSFSRIPRSSLCRLQVVLPTGDTLRAETSFPSDPIQQEFTQSTERFLSEFDLNGKHYSYEPMHVKDSDPRIYWHEETSRFDLPAVTGAVWVFKVGSTGNGKTFVDETLATNCEEWTDRFNLTGQLFSASTEPMALTMYPDVAGQPLHDRYLRFPGGRQGEGLVAISGDFKGPHYGALGSVLSRAIADQYYEWVKSQLDDTPYGDNILLDKSGLDRQAGYLEFWTVSPEYDKYLKDVAQFEMLQESTDLVGIYHNTNIYTNIEGGTGIFGANIAQTFYWSCGVWKF